MVGPSERKSSEAPSYFHFYTNLSPDAPLLDQVLWGADHSSVSLQETKNLKRDVSYAQLALSSPSTPASGGRTPLRTPVSTPHSPFLHPHTASVPSPCSPGSPASFLPKFLHSRRYGSFRSPQRSSQNNPFQASSSSKSSVPFYTNLARSLSTIVSKSSTQASSQQPLKRFATESHGPGGTGSTCTVPSKWFSYSEGHSATLPSFASTCSVPANISSKAKHVLLIQSSFSPSQHTPVPSKASKVFSNESIISLPSSTSHAVPLSSSSSSEIDTAVPTASTLPHRSNSKLFKCERVYINTLPRVSVSLPESFLKSFQREDKEPSLPTSSTCSPKSPKSPTSRKLKRRKGDHGPDEIEMM